MNTRMPAKRLPHRVLAILLPLLVLAGCTAPTSAPESGHTGGGEANLHLPDLGAATFFGGAINGIGLLWIGLVVCLGRREFVQKDRHQS